jgi:hypothetical protein
MDVPVLAEEGEEVVRRSGAEHLSRRERELEGRRLEMGEKDVQVVRVHARLFRWIGEQELRVVDDVLVDRRRRGDEDRDARVAAPAGAADLLPRGRDGPRIASQHGHVQAADVDAQLQRVRAHDPEDVPLAQAILDRPALGGKVAAPVPSHARPRPAMLSERLAEPGQDQLHPGAGASEHDGLAAGAQERQGPSLGERDRRAPGARRRVDDRRVDEEHVALAGGRAVPVHHERGPAGEAGRQLAGVGDRRGARDDDRGRAIVAADSQQAPQHVADVTSEQAAIQVQLVHDDHLDLLEQLEPLGMVGKDRRVEHVGVGHDDLAGQADRGADRRRRVAVVGGCRHLQP